MFIPMAMESMVIPLPSEAIMPFAGFLLAQGHWTIWQIAVWSTLGSLIGSLISYLLGYAVGRPVLLSWGKYIGLNYHHLDKTENWFKTNGNKTIFIGRFIPVVRHLISIPAGTAKMPVGRFLILTGLGALLWNMFLTYIGFTLGRNWTYVKTIGHWLDVIFVILIPVILIWWWYRRKKAVVVLTK